MPWGGGRAGPPRRHWLADRPDAPGPVAPAEPARGIDGDVLPVDGNAAAPGAELGEPLRVQRHPVAGPQDVRLFPDDVEQALPGEIGCDALGFVEDQPQFAQRLDDLDPVAVDVLVEPVLVDGIGQVTRSLRVPTPDEPEPVL